MLIKNERTAKKFINYEINNKVSKDDKSMKNQVRNIDSNSQNNFERSEKKIICERAHLKSDFFFAWHGNGENSISFSFPSYFFS